MPKFLFSLVFTSSMSFSSLFSGNASANTFAGGIPEAVPFTYNSITYDRYIVISRGDYNICSNTLAFYFVSTEMTAAGYPNSGNSYSLTLAYPGDVPALNSIPSGAHMAIFSAVNVSGVCSWTGASFEGTATGPQGAYTFRGDKSEAIHDHNFDLYTNDSVWGTLPYTFTSTYSSWGTWPGNGLKYEGAGFLSFPLAGVTPYTAEVSSVMDQTTLGTGTVYGAGENGEVVAFNEETGNVGPYSGTTCYRKADSSAFLTSGFNYDGYTGGPTYLCYDAHPGYDYPKAENTNILATSGGDLCVAHNVTSKPSPATSVWRNTTKCPLEYAPGQSFATWAGYHVLYIMHGSLYINGSTNEYITVYLHTKDLDATVESEIFDNGYSHVNRLQTIGRVGDVSPTGVGFHVHLETYKKVSGTWERIDPYGDGTNNILWEH